MMMANVEGAVKDTYRQKRFWVRRENGGSDGTEQEEFLLIPVNLKGRMPKWKANDKLCVARCASVGSDIGVGQGVSLQTTCVVDERSKYAHGNGDSVANEHLEVQASVEGTAVKAAKNSCEAKRGRDQIAPSHIKDPKANEELLKIEFEKLRLRAERIGFAVVDADYVDGALTPPLAGVEFRKLGEPYTSEHARLARHNVSPTGSRRSRSSRRQRSARPEVSSPEKVRLNGSVAADLDLANASATSAVDTSAGNRESAEGRSEKRAQESSWQWHQNDWNSTQWEWQRNEWEDRWQWHWNDWDDDSESRGARGRDWASNHERYRSVSSPPRRGWGTHTDSCPSNRDCELAKRNISGVEL
jgi:hypothetical protein